MKLASKRPSTTRLARRKSTAVTAAHLARPGAETATIDLMGIDIAAPVNNDVNSLTVIGSGDDDTLQQRFTL